VSEGVGAAHGVSTAISYYKPIPPAVNTAGPTEQASRAAAIVVGDEHVQRNVAPSMGCEDFAFMLAARPGCYVWIGNGPIVDGVGLHSSRYEFNDDILAIGASYWATLVESILV
jgi:metal-dependent amidase/aminoacylase/carboxypeptidase family protein